MHRTGVEWIWRLVHEPRRLARRYLIEDLPFATRLLANVLFRRITTARRLRRPSTTDHESASSHAPEHDVR